MDQHEEMTKDLYRLDAEAKQSVEPQRRQIVQQINDLSRQRTKVQKQIFECIRDSTKPPSGDGEKGLKRVPKRPPTTGDGQEPVTLSQVIDDCLAKSVPNYSSPDWSRFPPEGLRPKRVGQFQESFEVSGLGADHALNLDEAVYGRWKDRELMRDYLVGWLTHCLSRQKVLPMQDPRIPYRQFMESREPPGAKNPKRITERFEEFSYGYRSYPLPPFWDHDLAGSSPPTQ